jgi:hypothetical protein
MGAGNRRSRSSGLGYGSELHLPSEGMLLVSFPIPLSGCWHLVSAEPDALLTIGDVLESFFL